MQTIWQFKTKNFIVQMSCEYQEESEDLSFDETGETAEKVASGEWSVYTFHAEVIERATFNTIGEDYLGGSIYADPKDFRDHVGLAIKSREDGRNYGSYFTDMIREAINEARKTYAKERPQLRLPA
jgi:hypothetical protein